MLCYQTDIKGHISALGHQTQVEDGEQFTESRDVELKARRPPWAGCGVRVKIPGARSKRGLGSRTQDYSALLATPSCIFTYMWFRTFCHSLTPALIVYQSEKLWAYSHTTSALAKSGLRQTLLQNHIYILQDSLTTWPDICLIGPNLC